ncbi:ArsR family transcriptional regulator [Luteitalea sp. TBR-22]|nr:ArsR family transcriptional regulator [Luteitalea sp. TBR-22]
MLEGQTLSVGELCDILQLPQSTISRHLKTLTDGGWAQVRREGTSRLYSLVPEDLDEASVELWRVVKAHLATMPAVAQDRVRLARVLADRRAESAAFFSRSAGEWDALRDDLYGSTFHLEGLLAVLDPSWTVADLGCGTGRTSSVLAPFVRQVVAVDASAEMLTAARGRLKAVENVDLREGALEALPIADGSVDLALLVLVLHHLGDPAAALREARRVLVPGGRLLVIDMQPHDRDEYRGQMGHVWLGFSEAQIGRLLVGAGFTGARVVPLPPAPAVRGPALFVASASARASADQAVPVR